MQAGRWSWVRPMSERARDFGGDSGFVVASGGGYTAFCRDFEYAWQWEIRKGDEQIYSGAALSEASAKRTIAVVAKAFGIVMREVSSTSDS